MNSEICCEGKQNMAPSRDLHSTSNLGRQQCETSNTGLYVLLLEASDVGTANFELVDEIMSIRVALFQVTMIICFSKMEGIHAEYAFLTLTDAHT